MVYFEFKGKFKKMYDIVACDYYVKDNTIVLYEQNGTRWIYIGVNGVKVTEGILFNIHKEDS